MTGFNHYLMRGFVLFFSLFVSYYTFANENFPSEMKGDTREVRHKNSPKWVEAVGRIELKWVKKRERQGDKTVTYWDGKNCSISLVNFDYKDSLAGITAAHCVFSPHFVKYDMTDADIVKFINSVPEIDGRKKNAIAAKWTGIQPETDDLKQRVVFKTNNGKTIIRKIKKIHVMKYGHEPSTRDIAVVEFDKSISKIDIIPLIFRTADIQAIEYKQSTKKGWKDKDTGKWIYEPEPWEEAVDYNYPSKFGVAGYSADTGRGQKGKVLTYSWPCTKISNGVSSRPYFENCYTYQGASGGAIVVKAKVGKSWCWNDNVDEDAETPKWLVPLSTVQNCEEPEHWNEVIIKGRTVGHLPKDKPIVFHIGNVKAGRADGNPGFTWWAPNTVEFKTIKSALATIYGY